MLSLKLSITALHNIQCFQLMNSLQNMAGTNQVYEVRLVPGMRVDLSYSAFENTGQCDEVK